MPSAIKRGKTDVSTQIKQHLQILLNLGSRTLTSAWQGLHACEEDPWKRSHRLSSALKVYSTKKHNDPPTATAGRHTLVVATSLTEMQGHKRLDMQIGLGLPSALP